MKPNILLLLPLAIACGVDPPPPRYAVAFYAEADPDEPLAGVEILANGQTVGTSDDTRLVQAILEGPEGTPFEIPWHSPHGHRTPEAPQTLRLRAFSGLSPDASSSLSMNLRCPPNLRHVGFVVRTNQRPDLVVKLDHVPPGFDTNYLRGFKKDQLEYNAEAQSFLVHDLLADQDYKQILVEIGRAHV